MLTEGIAASCNSGSGRARRRRERQRCRTRHRRCHQERARAHHLWHRHRTSCPTMCSTPRSSVRPALLIRYSTAEELHRGDPADRRSATASLQLTGYDYLTAARLPPALEQKVGRIIVNGWPTGVEVQYAMVHGYLPPPRHPDHLPWARWPSTGSCGPSPTRTCRRNCSRYRCRIPTSLWLNRRIDGVVRRVAAEEAATQKAEVNVREPAAHYRPR